MIYMLYKIRYFLRSHYLKYINHIFCPIWITDSPSGDVLLRVIWIGFREFKIFVLWNLSIYGYPYLLIYALFWSFSYLHDISKFHWGTYIYILNNDVAPYFQGFVQKVFVALCFRIIYQIFDGMTFILCQYGILSTCMLCYHLMF